LDNTHLMRLAGRFSRRLPAFAEAHNMPIVECPRGERKHVLAEEYLGTDGRQDSAGACCIWCAGAVAWPLPCLAALAQHAVCSRLAGD